MTAAKWQRTKFVFAHSVVREGVGQKRYPDSRLARDLHWWDRVRVILKSDNEPAILNLLSEALKTMRFQDAKQTSKPPTDVYK